MLIRKPFLAAGLVVAMCIPPFTLASNAELRGGVMFVSTPRQGEIGGNTRLKGKSGIPLLAVKTSTDAPGPRDSHTGMASGKRQHNPITVVKEIDAASPKLMQALRTSELLQVTIEFETVSKSPEKLNLKNAIIKDIHNVRQGTKEVEEIELIYQEIEWTFAGGKKTAADDWHQ